MKLKLNDDILIETADVSIASVENNGVSGVLMLTMKADGRGYGSSRMVQVTMPIDVAREKLSIIEQASMTEVRVHGETLPTFGPVEHAWLTAPRDRQGSPNALANNEADMELLADCGTDAKRWATELGDIIRDDATNTEDVQDAWLALWFAAAMEAARRETERALGDAKTRAQSESETSLRAALGAEGAAAARAVQFLDDLSADAAAAKADIVSLRSVNLPVGDERE